MNLRYFYEKLTLIVRRLTDHNCSSPFKERE